MRYRIAWSSLFSINLDCKLVLRRLATPDMPPPRTSFYTAGERLAHDDSYIITNQTYVQYYPPTSKYGYNHYVPTRSLPLLFIHGGGLTGAMWEATPDGRPGWAVLASEAGYPVYIIDTIDNGRSQRAPDAFRATAGTMEHRTAKQIWDRFRIGPAEGFDGRKVFEDGQFPIEAFDMLVGGQAGRRRGNDMVEARGIVDAINKIGECEVIAHSHGAALMMDVLDKVKHHVKQLALVEPGGTSAAGNLTTDVRTVVYWGDYLDTVAAWEKIAASFNNEPVEVVKLPDIGLKGNSHFPMFDRNSEQVFKVILKWLGSDPSVVRPSPLPFLLLLVGTVWLIFKK
jgi:pimeloyl-ACP methyl ester carboxylesterase